MITVATCSNPAEAMLLKSMLEANNISAYVPDNAQVSPDFSGGGIRVQVDDPHATAAQRILAEFENATPLDPEADVSDDNQGQDQSR